MMFCSVEVVLSNNHEGNRIYRAVGRGAQAEVQPRPPGSDKMTYAEGNRGDHPLSFTRREDFSRGMRMMARWYEVRQEPGRVDKTVQALREKRRRYSRRVPLLQGSARRVLPSPGRGPTSGRGIHANDSEEQVWGTTVFCHIHRLRLRPRKRRQ